MHAGAELRDYESLHRWSVAEPGRFWETAWDFCGVVGERGDVAVDPAPDLWRTRFFPDAVLSYAENLLRRDDEGTALRFVARGRRPADVLVARAARRWCRGSSRRCARPASARATGSPRGCPTCRRRIAAACWPRRASVPSSRRARPTSATAGRRRPLRPDRARSCCAPPTATSTAASGTTAWSASRRSPRQLPSVRTVLVVLLRRRHGRARRRSRAPSDGTTGSARHAAGAVEFARLPFDHPLLRPLLVGHDRRAEVHRAPRRRRAAEAPRRAPAALRRAARRPGLLLHDHRLDDVELAGVGARERRHASSLYDGSPVHPDADAAVRPRRRSRRHAVRDVGEVPRRAATRPALRPARHARPRPRCARSRSTGSPLVARGLRLRLRRRQGRRAPGVDLRRHRPVRLPRRRRSRPARCGAGEIQRPGARHGDRRRGRRRARRSARARRASWCAPRRSRRCRVGLLERPRRRARTGRPTSSASPGVWHQGDFAEWTEHGGMVIHGRSDATLNPGGVRIGTAEIYRQVEQIAEVRREPRHRPGLGRRRARSCCSSCCADGAALDDELERDDPAADPRPARRRATSRPGSSRSPTSRGPAAARSPSSPCATSSTASRSTTPRRSRTPRRSTHFRDLRGAAGDEPTCRRLLRSVLFAPASRPRRAAQAAPVRARRGGARPGGRGAARREARGARARPRGGARSSRTSTRGWPSSCG